MHKWLNRIILISILTAIPSFAFGYPSIKVTARVLNEQGQPIQDANVHVSYEISKKGGWGTDNFGKEGLSDSNGLFISQAKASARIGVTVRKEGYYYSRHKYEFKSTSGILLRKWEPWNPIIEVVLKRKRNPVPMFSKYLDWISVPELNKPIGFDLEVGDWVSPNGKGKVSDFIFNVKSISRSWTDYECNYTLTFSNKYDGIQEFVFTKEDQSMYRWPFEAPEDNYEPVIKKFRNDTRENGYKTNEKKNINYIFRVRSKVDKDGHIVESNYGKIEGEIRIVPGKINFLYSYNPDGTRNLENDNKKNLFTQK